MDKAVRIDGLKTGRATGDMTVSLSGQLALDLRSPLRREARHFVSAPSNALARRWLNQTGWPDRRLLLSGGEACGKTHLLHIWARKRDAEVLDASQLDHDVLASRFATMPASLAIDQIECVMSERALLHLLNSAREHRTTLLLASRYAPVRLPVILPDLASRLRAVTVIPIGEPEDDLRFALLLRLIAERQLVVSKPMVDWLLCYLPRTSQALITAVERLDHAGLAHGRPLTRALAREVLTELLGEEDD